MSQYSPPHVVTVRSLTRALSKCCPQRYRAVLIAAVLASIAAAASGQSGMLDTSFATGGKGTVGFNLFGLDEAVDIALQDDRRAVIAGYAAFNATDTDFAILRLTPSGTLDTTFGGGDGLATVAFDLGGDRGDFGHAVAIAPDGKIVVAGNVRDTSGNSFDFAVTRLLTDGTLDTSFDGDGRVVIPIDLGGSNNDFVGELAIQSDGKILLTGQAATSAPNGDSDCIVARLNTNGSLDSTFGSSGVQRFVFAPVGMESSDRCQDIQLQNDGKIVLTARSATTTQETVVARLTTAGTLDNTFGSGGVARVDMGSDPEAIEALTIDATGRIVITGLVDGAGWDIGVARLLTTGALDTSFAGDGTAVFAFDLGGTNNDSPRGIAIQPTGEIVIAGVADVGTDDNDFFALRLLADGTADTSFGSAGRSLVPFDLLPDRFDRAQAVVVRPDGRILLTGTADSVEFNASEFAFAQLHGAPPVFLDDFESGGTMSWSSTVP